MKACKRECNNVKHYAYVRLTLIKDESCILIVLFITWT